ncbi:MAG: ribosomal protein S18-alanine N-acetyltransferase [Acidobacteria bacterium]|nr:ribosomal protein S18-alanine N-acetyltransferase [Acidobacteriota bacterium]
MPVKIRSAVLADVPALLTIDRESVSAAHWTNEQYEQRVSEASVLVAEEEGEEENDVCGFVCTRVVADQWEIENIVVAETKRRRGVADALLQDVLSGARDHAATSVWLEVRESNDPARRLYEKYSFRESGRRRGYYQNPLEDAVLYELQLSRPQVTIKSSC